MDLKECVKYLKEISMLITKENMESNKQVNINLIVEAKKEYNNRLSKIISPFIYKEIESLYDSNVTSSPFPPFQKRLALIPKWDSDKIQSVYNELLEETRSDTEIISETAESLDKLLNAVFVINTKVLAVVNSTNTNIEITVPDFDNFLHKCFKCSAKLFYQDPLLWDTRVSSYELQKNSRKNLKKINSCIDDTVRTLLPLKNILKNSLKEDYLNSQESENIETEDNLSKNLMKYADKHLVSIENKEPEKDDKSSDLFSERSDEESEEKTQENSEENSDESLNKLLNKASMKSPKKDFDQYSDISNVISVNTSNYDSDTETKSETEPESESETESETETEKETESETDSKSQSESSKLDESEESLKYIKLPKYNVKRNTNKPLKVYTNKKVSNDEKFFSDLE